MQMGELGPCIGQPQLPRSDLVTRSAAELLEALSPPTLGFGALILGDFGDDAHGFQGGNTTFKALRPFLASLREPEFAVVADGVTALAAMSIEQVLREFVRAFAGCNHSVQFSGRRLRPSHGSPQTGKNES